MRTLALFVAACYLTDFSAAQELVPLDRSDRVGILEILVVDALGRSVEEDVVLTVRRMKGNDRGTPTPITRRVRLPYGTYELTARGSPAYPVDKTVEIRAALQIVTVALFVAPIELPWEGNFIRGVLPPASSERGCRWIRLLSPIAEREITEAKATTEGRFVVENVKPGRYLVVTIGPEGLCETYETVVKPDRVQDLVISRLGYNGVP